MTQEMIHHSKAVSRGSKSAFLIGDMPFGTYEISPELALSNAIKYVQQGAVESIKLEGGVEMASTVARITSVGIPVLGHIGLTPQRQTSLGGFKVQGKTLNAVCYLSRRSDYWTMHWHCRTLDAMQWFWKPYQSL
jgi:3-methyl-2-oxobutanoate hydroxymethyltransferase